ncbi:MAG: cyclic nucleotide-binding domain-containing protein [Polyangiales bacterium]
MGEDKLLTKARSKLHKALEANRYEDALKWLSELSRHEPSSARWPHKQGDLLRKLGRNDDAIRYYEIAVGLYADEGFIARAVAMAKTVVNLDPSRLDILERVDPQAAQQLRAARRSQRRDPLAELSLQTGGERRGAFEPTLSFPPRARAVGATPELGARASEPGPGPQLKATARVPPLPPRASELSLAPVSKTPIPPRPKAAPPPPPPPLPVPREAQPPPLPSLRVAPGPPAARSGGVREPAPPPLPWHDAESLPQPRRVIVTQPGSEAQPPPLPPRPGEKLPRPRDVPPEARVDGRSLSAAEAFGGALPQPTAAGPAASAWSDVALPADITPAPNRVPQAPNVAGLPLFVPAALPLPAAAVKLPLPHPAPAGARAEAPASSATPASVGGLPLLVAPSLAVSPPARPGLPLPPPAAAGLSRGPAPLPAPHGDLAWRDAGQLPVLRGQLPLVAAANALRTTTGDDPSIAGYAVPQSMLEAAARLAPPTPTSAGTLDRLSLPPRRPGTGLPPPEHQVEEIYGRALDAAEELAIDLTAPPDEIRFSNAPSGRQSDLALSEVEIAPRTPLPALPSLRPEPPRAETLAKLPLFPLFAELPKTALTRMIAGSQLVELDHGDYVLHQGDEGDALYGIVEGSVEVSVPGQAFQLTLAEGDVFGESSLLDADKSHADVIVMGTLLALRVPRSVLLEIVQEHAPLAGLLLELLTRRLLGNLLQVSPLFQDFDARGKSELAALFEVRRAAAGTMLAVVGKKMDGLYISLTGTLRINQPGAPERIALPGSMFGQNTFLAHSASQVDVIAMLDMILLRLPQAQFTRVAMQHPTVLARLTELSTSEVVRVTM